MSEVYKRAIVIRDLIEQATYIAQDNLDASDRFLAAAEETFKQLARMPAMGRLREFSHPKLAGIRQQSIKGFRKYLVFYRITESCVEILRVLHVARDIEANFEEEFMEDDSE